MIEVYRFWEALAHLVALLLTKHHTVWQINDDPWEYIWEKVK